MIPCLQELFPLITEWITAQNRDIFKTILSFYTPLTATLLGVRSLQEKPSLISLAANFGATQNMRLVSDASNPMRLGILGLYGLGKSTLVNALIGHELMTTRNGDWRTKPSLSAGWPIIIRHRRNTTTPSISIDPVNFVPVLKLLRRADFKPLEDPLQEAVAVAIWEEYEMSQSSSSEMNILSFSGTSEIQKILHSIGKLIRAFATIPRDDEEFQFNSSWPIITVCMTAFDDFEQPLEFIDLPGVGNSRLNLRDIEAQWKVSLESCDAFIYTVRAEPALLDSESLFRNRKLLKLIIANKQKPWLVIATHNDRLSTNETRRREEEEGLIRGFQNHIFGINSSPLEAEVVLCSPEIDLCAKSVRDLVQRSPNLPSQRDVESVGGEIIVKSLGHAETLKDLSHEEFTEYLDFMIQSAAMEKVVSTIKHNVIPSILELRSKRTMSMARDDVLSIHNDLELRPASGKYSVAKTSHRATLSSSFYGREALDRQRRISENIFKKAASFCASWSVTRLDSQRDWYKSVELHLLEYERSLQKKLDDIWDQIKGKIQATKPDAAFIIQKPRSVLKDFETQAAEAQFHCETQVKELAMNAWTDKLRNLLEHLESNIFAGAEEDGYQRLQRRVYEEIHKVQKQTCEQVLNKLIQRRGILHGLEPASMPEYAYWRAHEGRMRTHSQSSSSLDESLHLIIDLPRDSSTWVRTAEVRQQPASVSERASYLERWAAVTKTAAEAFETVGFLVTQSHPPVVISLRSPFSRAMDSVSLRAHLDTCKEQWYESMRRQSLATLRGALTAVALIGIRTVLDVFISDIQTLEASVNLSAEMCLSDTETGEMIVAESNAPKRLPMTIDRLKHDRVDVGDGFDLYNAQVKRMDENFIDGCNRTMDTLLVFAGLFSAVVTAFIIQIQQLLEKSPQDRTNELILIVIQQLNSSDFRPDISDHFTESGFSLAANLLLFGSLVVTLFAALAAILVKQWILSYDHRARAGSSFQAKARARYRAWSELENAHLLGVISAIPMLLHSGLFLFFAGLVAWLFKFGNRSIFGLTIGLTGLATLFYLMAGVIGSLKHGSQFQWRGVSFLRKIVRRKVPMQDPPFLEDATDSPTRDSTILVADDLSNANGIKLLPFHQDDVAIVCTAMESSISSSDVAREIMQLRNLMLLPGFDPETAFDDRRDPKLHSSRDHRLMVLQRCTSLAASCVVETTGTPWLKPEAAQQARAVCHFLEAYLQFKFSGSDHYQILRAAKLEALAEALIDYSLTQPGGRPADVVVAVAVIAKLSHKVNGYKSRCRQCFQFEHLLESFLYGNNGIMKRDEEEVQQLAVG
ncbi:hypothetical protein FRC17_003434, partial [Serendipita sp. 399]